MADTTLKLDASTKLALHRTQLAYERTLMAWIRTAMSLITFGFTIYKFFEYLAEAEHIRTAGRIGPRQFALGMIGLGLIALTLATFQHRRAMVDLQKEYSFGVRSLAGKLAAIVALSGLITLLAVVFRQ